MRTTFNAADILSLFFLLTLVPQCLGRPASALFGKGHKALPLAERRDSAIAERRESIIDTESILSRRSSVVTQEVAENVEADYNVVDAEVPILEGGKYNRFMLNQRSEPADAQAFDQLVQNMGYEAANIEARQATSVLTSGVYATSTTVSASGSASTAAYSVATSSLTAATTASPSASSSSSSAAASSSAASPSVASSSAASSSAASSSASSASASSASSASAASVASASAASASAAVTAASTVYPKIQTAMFTPTVVSTTIQGTAIHSPMMTYVSSQKSAALPALAVTPQINYVDSNMQTQYSMWNGSGSLIVNSANAGSMASLSTTPSMSRDQGKGGNVAGVNIFVFADTGAYSTPPASGVASFNGFTSNSIAVDRGMGPASGKPVTLSDPIGAYMNKNGATRGFIPWTAGEAAYNNMMISYSQRWAIWPESSFVPLNPTTSLLFAPIVYANTSGGSSFSYAGTTLVEITVPSIGGPVANRIAPLLFPKSSVEWGCMGGIRSFGPDGQTGGKVYILASAGASGLYMGRTNATTVTDAASYEFYQGSGIWNSTVPTSTSTAKSITYGAFSTVDIFYSPRHLTFIMVFQNVYCDNNIYWRWLRASKPILPTYAGGSWDDMVEAITMYSWGPSAVLMALPAPASGYTYGAGAHLGYFGANDITRGGNQMLLSWTAPTGQAGGTKATSYSTMTGMVTFT